MLLCSSLEEWLTPTVHFVPYEGTAPQTKIEHVLYTISNHHQFLEKFEKIISASWGKLSEKLKNDINISVDQAVLELLIKTCKILF